MDVSAKRDKKRLIFSPNLQSKQEQYQNYKKNLVSKPSAHYMGMMANVKNVHGHSYCSTVIGSPIENRDNASLEW
jgi:hypothetical protein